MLSRMWRRARGLRGLWGVELFIFHPLRAFHRPPDRTAATNHHGAAWSSTQTQARQAPANPTPLRAACALSRDPPAPTTTAPRTTLGASRITLGGANVEIRCAQAIATDKARAWYAPPRPTRARGHKHAPTPMVLLSIQRPVRVAPWTAPAVITAGSPIAGAPRFRAVLLLTAPRPILLNVRALPLTAKAVSTVFMEQRIG